MSINQYNRLGVIGPIDANGDEAHITDDAFATIGGIKKLVDGAGRIRFDGSHPSGCKIMLATPAASSAENDTASVRFFAGLMPGWDRDSLLCRSLHSSAITATFGTGTLDLSIGGETVSCRMADTIGSITLAGLGAALESAYASMTPQVHSPGSDGIASIIFPQVVAMDSLVVDVWNDDESDVYLVVDTHS